MLKIGGLLLVGDGENAELPHVLARHVAAQGQRVAGSAAAFAQDCAVTAETPAATARVVFERGFGLDHLMVRRC